MGGMQQVSRDRTEQSYSTSAITTILQTERTDGRQAAGVNWGRATKKRQGSAHRTPTDFKKAPKGEWDLGAHGATKFTMALGPIAPIAPDFRAPFAFSSNTDRSTHCPGCCCCCCFRPSLLLLLPPLSWLHYQLMSGGGSSNRGRAAAAAATI